MRLRSIALVVLLALAAAEFAAFGAFSLVLRERLSVHWRLDADAALAAVTPQDLAEFGRQFFDPELGWVFKPETTAIPYTAFGPDGSRHDPFAAGAPRLPRILAYGDSFTFGEDVGDAETWPHFLAARLGEAVANFGVAGYGPDQALVRLQRHLSQGLRPEIVVLGVLSENVARVVNRWRYLYTGGEVLNFKPMVSVGPGGVRMLPSPLSSLGADAPRSAARAARAGDYWAAYNDTRPRPGFPYLWATVRTAWYLSKGVRRWQDLWDEPAPRSAMDALIDVFASLGAEYGFSPVLLMIPMPQDLERDAAGQSTSYAAFVADARHRLGPRIENADVLAQPFERARFNLRPYAGHASAYGNEALAAAVAAALGRP